MTFHLGFTGTQSGMTQEQRLCIAYLVEHLPHGHAHHGDCQGADAQFHVIARAFALFIEGHPPTNPCKRAFCTFDLEHAPLPYLARNLEIVRSTELLLAAPSENKEQLRSGTWSTVRKARLYKKPLALCLPSGATLFERWPYPQGAPAGRKA